MFAGTPAAQEHSHPGARDMLRGTCGSACPSLIDKCSQNKVVFHYHKHRARQGCGDPLLLTIFLKRGGHRQAGCTWPWCCCLGVTLELHCETFCQVSEESWPVICMWAPTPGRCFPCTRPPTHYLFLPPCAHSQPGLHCLLESLLSRLRGQGSSPHDSSPPELRVGVCTHVCSRVSVHAHTCVHCACM